MARIIPLEKLTLKQMMYDYDTYKGLPEGLIKLLTPEHININRKYLSVPQTLDEFTKNLCYGQRVFLRHEEENDFGAILRVIDGYYYPLSTGKVWDENKALIFGKKVLNCKAIYLYPVAMHLISLVAEMADREKMLLHREPSKMELAAGIEKLNVFSELTSLDFLRDAMKITVPEVLLTPYNECLVRFMIQKETEEYKERYMELMQEEAKPRSKFVKDV